MTQSPTSCQILESSQSLFHLVWQRLSSPCGICNFHSFSSAHLQIWGHTWSFNILCICATHAGGSRSHWDCSWHCSSRQPFMLFMICSWGTQRFWTRFCTHQEACHVLDTAAMFTAGICWNKTISFQFLVFLTLHSSWDLKVKLNFSWFAHCVVASDDELFIVNINEWAYWWVQIRN